MIFSLLTYFSMVLIRLMLITPSAHGASVTALRLITGIDTTAPVAVNASAKKPDFQLTYNHRKNAGYGYSEAVADYKKIKSWNGHNTSITDGTLKVLLQKNAVGPSAGNVSFIAVAPGAAYELQFDIRFDEQFDWGAGGKVGFGLLIGKGNSGGHSGKDGNGGSARLMWYREGERIYLKPYIYHADQKNAYGDDFGKKFPTAKNLEQGKWYKVRMYVRSNTHNNKDGHLRITVNTDTLIDQPMRWTTNHKERLINQICLSTFRGGADDAWQSASDGAIYFNHISWSQLLP